MKKLLTLFLSVLFAFGAVGLIGCGEKTETVSTENISSPEMFLTIGESRLLSGTLPDGQEGVYVSKAVTATISPSTVIDQYLTWTLDWGNDAPLKNSTLSEYLQLTQDTEGSLTAIVNCYKSFRGSKAILTCTTRQGNKKATCEIVYEGIPSSLSITPAETLEQYNLGKDTVDLLYVGNTYQLNVAVDNIFHDAGTNFNDYVLSVSGVGTVTLGVHSFARTSRWVSHNNVVDFDSIASNFITTTLNGTLLTIKPTKNFYDYYESTKEITDGYQYINALYSLNVDSDGNLPYFVVTVSHRTLGFSSQYKFFIGEQVSNVSMSSSTITF